MDFQIVRTPLHLAVERAARRSDFDAMIAVGFARMAHRRQRVAFVVVQRNAVVLVQIEPAVA